MSNIINEQIQGILRTKSIGLPIVVILLFTSFFSYFLNFGYTFGSLFAASILLFLTMLVKITKKSKGFGFLFELLYISPMLFIGKQCYSLSTRVDEFDSKAVQEKGYVSEIVFVVYIFMLIQFLVLLYLVKDTLPNPDKPLFDPKYSAYIFILLAFILYILNNYLISVLELKFNGKTDDN